MTKTIPASLLLLWSSVSFAFDAGRASFALHVNDIAVPYRVFAVYAQPGEQLEVNVVEPAGRSFELEIAGRRERGTKWIVEAPIDPGLREFAVSSPDDRIQVNLLIMHPAEWVENGRLFGYDIGAYPERALDDNPIYEVPAGFVRLDAETESVRLSPHFTLGQFRCKQSEVYPAFVVLRETLLLKLELLLERINARGIDADSLVVMSGYRTPNYNRAIGNVPYSRHVYGGAADIFVDVNPVDGVMDDLDGNGTNDYRDAQFLYALADQLFGEAPNQWLSGGQGVYRRNPAHGPFLHIDARGRRARWGLIPAPPPASVSRVPATAGDGR